MRGEFLGVWADMWLDIWLPLTDRPDVPDDIFAELYRELTNVLRSLSSDEAVQLVISDGVQLKEAFHRALASANVDTTHTRLEDVFSKSGALDLAENVLRRAAVETALETLIGDSETSKKMLSVALSELAADPAKREEVLMRSRESIINDRILSKAAFKMTQHVDIGGEPAVVSFLENVYGIVEDLAGESVANDYFNLLDSFVLKFSLRYDLRRPCILCPTLPGVFANLIRDLRALSKEDRGLEELMRDFDEAIRDLRFGMSSGRISTCITKEVMLLEALTSLSPNVKTNTLADMCGEIRSWPHPAVSESLKKLYGFASDRSGIR